MCLCVSSFQGREYLPAAREPRGEEAILRHAQLADPDQGDGQDAQQEERGGGASQALPSLSHNNDY